MTSAVATITSRGQVVIPYKIRKSLNLKTHQKILFTLDEKTKHIFITPPTADVLSLAGKFSSPKKASFQEERDFFENQYERV